MLSRPTPPKTTSMRCFPLLALLIVAATTPAQDFVARSITVPATQKRGVSYTFDASWQNADRVVSAPAHEAGIYLSNDATITWRDVLLRTTNHPGLPPLASHRLVTNVTMPSGALLGTRYLAIAVDHLGKISETNEDNNIQKQAVQVVPGPNDLPDLVVSSLTASPTVVYRSSTIDVTTTVQNIGIGDSASSYTGIYLSDDSVISSTDTLLTTQVTLPLATMAVDTLRNQISVGSASTRLGTHYLGAYADQGAAITESNETNNTRATRIDVQGLPDLRVDTLSLDRNSQIAGGVVRAHYIISNRGDITAPESTVDIMLGPSTLDPRALVLDRKQIPALAPNATYTWTATVQIPYHRAPTQPSYIWVVADATRQILELSETNNRLYRVMLVTEYTGTQLQLEFVADGSSSAISVTRVETVLSASAGGRVTMALKSKPLAGHWVLTSWSQTATFTYDVMTEFSLGLLNSPTFPMWFARLDAVTGLAFPRFVMPNVTLSSSLRVYGRTFALQPDFSGVSGTAGFITFDLKP
ncbi:MAG: hypothetical protein KDC95_09905 [Planctomycetes bacterium]|nr:hypothetical protein [Planctomycetota bacterium]